MKRINSLISYVSSIILVFVVTASNLYGQCCTPYSSGCLQQNDGACHLFYGIEGLYWTVSQSDLNYAVEIDPSNSDAILGKGKTHFLEYKDWKPGVRGWMGWNWAYGWDLKVGYTYFSNEAKGRVDTENKTIDLKASLFHPDSEEKIAEEASGKLKLDYHTVDVIFGKILCFCDYTVVLNTSIFWSSWFKTKPTSEGPL